MMFLWQQGPMGLGCQEETGLRGLLQEIIWETKKGRFGTPLLNTNI
jgi:hypothetical protein